ncbi:MAG TPA: phosphoribosyl-AMP cyclohydrolase [Opitutaceae bacterium]|nr:phosphoribosyl-AMP cyclohydrolase [Opitutaceae bacterium]
MSKPASFPARTTPAEIELGTLLQPKFGPDGLIPCITVDHATNDVLMFAFMNAEALDYTIRNRTAAYWSRSRNRIWIKGEQSGNSLKVKDLYVDCDQDVILLKVENTGPGACHNGYRSCFYRRLAEGADLDKPKALKLEFSATRAFDPAAVYKQ